MGDDLDLSFADRVGGWFGDAGDAIAGGANEVFSAWASKQADNLRGTDGNKQPAPTTASQYDQTVVTPTDGRADAVAAEINGELADLKKWALVGLAVTAAAFLYSRS